MSGLDPITRNCVAVRGNTTAPRTMVLVHSFGTDQSAWSSVVAAFEHDYRGGFTEQDLDETYGAVMENYEQWVDRFAPQVMGHHDRPRLAQAFAASMKAIPAERALTVLCSIFQSDHRPLLAGIDRPTLVVQAAHDIAVPLAAAQYLHEHIRGSRLELIDTEGHLPHLSAPAAVIAAMRRFLGDR